MLRRAVAHRGSPALLSAVAALLLTLSVLATPSWAIVAKVHNHGYGITPRRGVDPTRIAGASRPAVPAAAEPQRSAQRFAEPPGGNLKYFGGPVMHSNTTHVIYWDPGGEFTTTTKGIVDAFLTGVAHDKGLASNVFAVDAQFTDATGNAAYSASFAGALTDTAAYPASGCTVPKVEADPGPPYTHCLTDTQLQTQLEDFIGAEELPTGSTQLYFLLLPHKVVTCFEGSECSNNVFCAYHSYIKPGTAGEIIYADIPFSLLDTESAKGCQFDGNAGIQTPNGDRTGTDSSTRFADVALKYVSHEYSEAITDPLVGGFVAGKETTAWVDSNGFENGDKCNAKGSGEDGVNANAFLPVLGGKAAEDTLFNQTIDEGGYYLQSEWDNAAKGCLMQPLAISAPAFTFSAGTVGSPVSFSGSASDPYGHLELTWAFGDGSHGEGAAPAHTYAAPGEYTVTMSSKDALTGSTGSVVSHAVVVAPTAVSPTAAFTVTTASPTAGSPVSFDGSGSKANEGSITKYEWSFGDGAHGEGAAPSHTYAAAGTYEVTLTVTNSASLSNSTTHGVVVAAATSGGGGGGETGGGTGSGGTGSGGTGSGGGSASGGASGGTLTGSLVPVQPIAPSARVALAGTSLSVRHGGKAIVALRCTGAAGTCAGELTLVGRRVVGSGGHRRTVRLTLARSPFTINAAGTTGVPLQLTPAARALLRSLGGRLPALLTIHESSPAPAETLTANVRLKLTRHAA